MTPEELAILNHQLTQEEEAAQTDEQKAIRRALRQKWIEEGKDEWTRYAMDSSKEIVPQLLASIASIDAVHLPQPRVKLETDDGNCLIICVSAEIHEDVDTTIEETQWGGHMYHVTPILLHVEQIYGKMDGQIYQGPRDVFVSCQQCAGFVRTLDIYQAELLSEEPPKIPVAANKRGRLTEPDRIWRYNYYMRVYVGQIPKRIPCDADASAGSTAWDLWRKAESPTPEQQEAFGVWYQNRHRRDRARMVDGKYYVLRFNRVSGMFEREEVDSIDHQDERVPFDELQDILFQTTLHYPPSDRALPSATKMDADAAERWFRRCPPFMTLWKQHLLKEQIMTIAF